MGSHENQDACFSARTYTHDRVHLGILRIFQLLIPSFHMEYTKLLFLPLPPDTSVTGHCYLLISQAFLRTAKRPPTHRSNKATASCRYLPSPHRVSPFPHSPQRFTPILQSHPPRSCPPDPNPSIRYPAFLIRLARFFARWILWNELWQPARRSRRRRPRSPLSAVP